MDVYVIDSSSAAFCELTDDDTYCFSFAWEQKFIVSLWHPLNILQFLPHDEIACRPSVRSSVRDV